MSLPASPSPSAPRLTALLLGVLGFIGAVSPFATDMYLASFGSIQHDLATTASMVQLTLSVFFLGNAAGQLLIGPLSDGLGRRRILLISLSVYAAGGIALVFTPTIEVFVALRLLLGFTGSAGIVLARAIAVDLSEGETAVRALSLIAMMGGLGPLIAPMLGGFTHEFWGWRGTLATLAAISVLMLALAWRFVPESLPRSERREGGLRTAFTSLGPLLRSPRYLCFTLAFIFGFCAMISYISASPFVGQNVLAMPPLVYAFGFATSGTALVLTNIANARIAPRVGPRRMLAVGISLLLAAATAMLLLSLTGTLAAWSFICCAFVLTAGAGMAMSNASALALAEAAQARGLGAALLGSGQFAVAGLLAPLVGAWGDTAAIPMGVVVFGTAVVSASCALIASRSRR